MSEAVLADAQFSAVRVFRPFEGFEAVYQDQPVSVPIAIPGTLDSDAGKNGFDSNLLSGISVPLGSKLMIWVPSIFNDEGVLGLSVQSYNYRFLWRVRNIRDFRASRAAYHFPRQSPGTNNQFVVPAAAKVAIYETQGEDFPANKVVAPISQFSTYEEARQRAFIESVSFDSAIPDPPLTPAGAQAAYQQGLAASDAGSNMTVTYNSIQMDVEGDELMVIVNRNFSASDEDRLWDFAGRDSGFSAFYGTNNGARDPIRDMGIYVLTGSNP